MTGIRSFDIEPGTCFWDEELSYSNQATSSRVQLVSFNLKNIFLSLFLV